jgi:ferredoxin-NADP reductase
VKAALRTLTPRTADTVTLRLDCSLQYRAGQAVKLTLPGDSKPRYFSISSSPTEPGYLEVTAKLDTSPLAVALQKLKRGDSVDLEGPLGSFCLPDPVRTPLCFIAAGTGVTPFRSMIRSLMDQDVAQDSWLLHSVKTQKELLFSEEFRDWSGSYRQFRYVPTITQDFDDNWDNETGRINEVLIRKHIPADVTTFLLCGPPSFVGDMESLLKTNMAVPAERVRREQW